MEVTAIDQHCVDQAEAKGITWERLNAVLDFPDLTYPSVRYPGQWKFVGQGICVAVEDGVAVTVFEDQVVTELRSDQQCSKVAIEGQRKAAERAG